MAVSNVRDNFAKWQKYNTVRITKELQQKAKELEEDVSEKIATKLEETLKDNIIKSYQPRSSGSYVHTNQLVNSIYVEKSEGKVMVKVKDNIIYNDGGRKDPVSTAQVYDFLRFGTKGSTEHKRSSNGVEYDYVMKSKYYIGKVPVINYPTPPHPFEEHTQEAMNGYIESLKQDILRKNRRK